MTRCLGVRSIIVALAALCLAMGVPAGALDADTTLYFPVVGSSPLPAATPDPNALIEARIAELVNAARSDEGLAPLALADELTRAARRHSLDMATHGLFDHVGSDGSQPDERMSEAGYAWHACGENIGAGYTSPEDVVAAWMSSDGHRCAILSDTFRDMGVGYAYDPDSPYRRYYTLDLATRAP